MLIWKKRYNAAKEQHLAIIHDYILIYARDRNAIGDFVVPGDEDYYKTHFVESDEHLLTRGKFMTQPLEAGNSMDVRTNLRFPIPAPDGTEIWPRRQWVWGKEKVEGARLKGGLKFYRSKDGAWKVRHKQYAKDEDGNYRKVKPFTIFDKCYTQDGTKEMSELFGDEDVFPFPKPTRLIQHFLDIADDRDGLYLDFFAGSGSLAQAIFELNRHDRGNRKFILVQLPEPTDIKDYPTIAEITKERLRRAGKKIRAENPLFAGDLGFRVFKLASSNIRAWEPDRDKLAETLEASIEHLKTDRTEQDILFELLLKLGLDLCVPIETRIFYHEKHEAHEKGGDQKVEAMMSLHPQDFRAFRVFRCAC